MSSLTPPRPRQRFPHGLCALTVCVVAVAMAGCGTPPELRTPRGVPVPSPAASGTPSAGHNRPAPSPPVYDTIEPPPTRSPSASGFAEDFAIACGGRPSSQQVIRAVRRDTRLLADGAEVRVEVGPLCAGTWQYTMLSVPSFEPLAVVTRGDPGALRIVTAGTDVCSIPVRTQAPLGIRTAACA